MHLITFFGAQGPVGGGLRAVLDASSDALAACSYFAPHREVFAAPIREAIDAGTADADRQWSVISKIADGPAPDGLILVNEHYWSSSALILDGGELYADAEGKSVFIDELFRPQRYTVLLAIDNFAEFFPKLRNKSLRSVVRAMPWEQVYELSWYDMVLGLRAACPAQPASAGCVQHPGTRKRGADPIVHSLARARGIERDCCRRSPDPGGHRSPGAEGPERPPEPKLPTRPRV